MHKRRSLAGITERAAIRVQRRWQAYRSNDNDAELKRLYDQAVRLYRRIIVEIR